jgi:hypothetical protein
MSILSGEKFAENNYIIFNFQKYFTLFTKIERAIAISIDDIH